MCVTRVAKVLSVQGSRATVRFLESDVVADIDVSMVDVKRNSFVEVFADSALTRLSREEAEWKREAWSLLLKSPNLPR